jgi:outer membrane immunogenic protein
MNRTFVIIPAALAFASPALAQDDTEAPSGPRIEAIIGYDRLDAGLEGTDDFDGNDEDVVYGGAIGYDFSNGMISFGVEAEVTTSGLALEERITDLEIDGRLYAGDLSIDSNPEFYVGARLGYGAGRSIFYLKAGYAMSSIDIDADGTVDGVPDSFNADIDLDGLRLGVGFEYALTDNFYLKTEYRYTDYTGGEIEALGQTLDIDAALDEIDLNRHQVVMGAGLRF